jgi:hypothetical protein
MSSADAAAVFFFLSVLSTSATHFKNITTYTYEEIFFNPTDNRGTNISVTAYFTFEICSTLWTGPVYILKKAPRKKKKSHVKRVW